MFLYYFNTYIV